MSSGNHEPSRSEDWKPRRAKERNTHPPQAAPQPSTPTPPQALPSGILPSANQLRELEEAFPGLAQILVEEYRATLEHQRHLDRRAQNDARLVAVLGLILSFVGIVIGSITHQAVGSIGGTVVGVVDLVALVTIFLRGVSR